MDNNSRTLRSGQRLDSRAAVIEEGGEKKEEGVTEQIVALKPAQVVSLLQLAQAASQARLAAVAAERTMQFYIQSIADAHEVNGRARMRLSLEKKTLTFIQEKK